MIRFIRNFFVFLGVLFFVSCIGALIVGDRSESIKSDSILHLKLDGVILTGNEHNFLENLRKFGKDKSIRGVLIEVNCPGGVVGPSQEIYTEIKRIRDEYKKPVVVSGSGLVASGAYYAAVGASKIVTNPGTMMGSIGVILQFANLEKLYSWAKIERYAITTGPYKDSGADYRSMKSEERKLFQDMIDEVHMQFKTAVAEGRGMDIEKVSMYADGRVFTGETAVKLGFADQLGSFEDARRLIGKLSDLGEDPVLYVPPKKRPDFFQFFEEMESSSTLDKIKNQLHLNLIGKPLYLLPGSI